MYPDFKELLLEFNAHGVKYLIVGGYAVSFHGEPRATKDLDLFIKSDPENARAAHSALAKFGAPVESVTAADLAEPGSFFRMGTPPVMVDILPTIRGVDFDDAWQRRVNVRVDDELVVPIISREDLLSSKLAVGRAQDLADAEALEKFRGLQEAAPPLDSVSVVFESIEERQSRAARKWHSHTQRAEHAPDLSKDAPEHNQEHSPDDDLEI